MKHQIYMAGGITDVEWSKAKEWRDKLSTLIDEACKGQWYCFDPCDHFNEFGEVISEAESVRYDLDHLRHSRIMVVSFEHTQRSIGTAIEIGVAYENKIPIIGFNPNKEELHPWYKEICTHICTSFDGLLMFLCDHYLNEGGRL